MATSKVQVNVGGGGPTLLYVPQINLNGTDKQSLMDELYKAHNAMQAAVKAVGDITVHGRDWQTVEDETEYLSARTAQNKRVRTLHQLQSEICKLYLLVEQQG